MDAAFGNGDLLWQWNGKINRVKVQCVGGRCCASLVSTAHVVRTASDEMRAITTIRMLAGASGVLVQASVVWERKRASYRVQAGGRDGVPVEEQRQARGLPIHSVCKLADPGLHCSSKVLCRDRE